MAEKKAPPWFYCDSPVTAGESMQLTGEEARHATGSRRLEPGDALTLFDGRGRVSQAQVLSGGVRGRAVKLAIRSVEDLGEPRFKLHLASALPKGDRQSVMLDMATQLGIASFTPLVCEHSVARAGANSERRWLRLMIEACKQSRNPYLPKLHAAQTPDSLASSFDGVVWVAHPGGVAAASLPMIPGETGSLLVVIGPEGGLTGTEVAVLEAGGASKVSLGAGILRTEAAAVALLSYVRLRLVHN